MTTGWACERRGSSTDADVVAVEGDVDRSECDLRTGELLDQPPEALGDRYAPRLDADEGDAVEIRVALDDLMRDADESATQRFTVEQQLSRLFGSSQTRLLSGLTGPG